MNSRKSSIYAVFFLCLFFCTVTATEVSAAVVFDASSSAHTGANSSDTLSWSHTAGGEDRLLLVGVSINGNTTVAAVTYAGMDLTRLAARNQGTQARVSLWALTNPPAGTNTVTVSMAQSTRFVAGAHSYTGADGDNPYGVPAVNSGSGTVASLLVGTAFDELVVDVVARRGDTNANTITIGSGQTESWNAHTSLNNANTGVSGGGSFKAAGAMSWNWSQNRAWAMAGVSLKPKPTPPPPPPPDPDPDPDPDPEPEPDTTPPTAPSNLVAAAVSSFQINLSWDASSDDTGVDGYKIYRDGEQIASTMNTTFSGFGVVGDTTYTYEVSAFDAAGNESELSSAVSVATPPEPDTTPPSAIVDLNALNFTQTSVDLVWTAPGDDGDSGQASSYDIRYSTDPITDGNWNSATNVTDAFAPSGAGTSELFVVTGLNPQTVYYFGIKTVDETGNTSALSNEASALTQGFTLAVSLSADPITGISPLNDVDLSATVSGTALGNIAYTFYCDRGDEGADITLPYDLRIEESTEAVLLAEDLCDYSAADLYVAKVIVERGALQEQNRVEIIVTEPASIDSNLPNGASPSSGGSSGSGGGGFFGDTKAPSAVKDVRAMLEGGILVIKWLNPDSIDFAGVRIVRKEGEEPNTNEDGTVVFEGPANEFSDLTLERDKIYYYSIFAYDRKPNYSSSVVLKIFLPSETAPGEKEIEIEVSAPETVIEFQPGGSIAEYFQFTKPLFFGLSNSDVVRLQEFLAQDFTIYPEGLVTGYFGTLTKRAVQRFQCEYDIICSGEELTTGYGRVGPKTMAKLNQLLSSKEMRPRLSFNRALYQSIRGEDVARLQEFLAKDKELYPEGLVTGYYGEFTKQAVRRFQCRHAIVCSGDESTTGYGRVGPRTRAVLNERIAANE